MSSSFFIYAPSNTGGEGNTSSQFTIQLPKKLEFHSQWYVALTNIIYPCSWDTLGTEESQYFEIHWNDGLKTRMIIPNASYKDVEEFIPAFQKLLKEKNLDKKKRIIFERRMLIPI